MQIGDVYIITVILEMFISSQRQKRGLVTLVSAMDPVEDAEEIAEHEAKIARIDALIQKAQVCPDASETDFMLCNGVCGSGLSEFWNLMQRCSQWKQVTRLQHHNIR
jgi:hypothetical protein